MQSGVRGKLYADEVRAAREAQDMELLQKLMETKGKIADIEHGYKEKRYAVGTEADKLSYDRKFAAAKEMGLDDREAARLAAEAVEKEKDRKNRLQEARIRSEAAIDRAQMLTPAQKANLLKSARSAVDKRIKDDIRYGLEMRKNPGRYESEVQTAYNDLLQAAGFPTIGAAPSAAPSPGGNRPPLSSFQR